MLERTDCWFLHSFELLIWSYNQNLRLLVCALQCYLANPWQSKSPVAALKRCFFCLVEWVLHQAVCRFLNLFSRAPCKLEPLHLLIIGLNGWPQVQEGALFKWVPGSGWGDFSGAGEQAESPFKPSDFSVLFELTNAIQVRFHMQALYTLVWRQKKA